MGAIARAIREKLSAGLSPTRLEVIDESDLHAGHAGARRGGESHFSVVVESPAFVDLSRIARQRLVFALLADEMRGSVHALSIKTFAPGEGQPTPRT